MPDESSGPLTEGADLEVEPPVCGYLLAGEFGDVALERPVVGEHQDSTGPRRPRRSCRSSRLLVSCFKRSSAVVVFPLPAAPPYEPKPGSAVGENGLLLGDGRTGGRIRMRHSCGRNPRNHLPRSHG